VVQPNEDGSYWRKIVRNKMVRMKEKRRVQAGRAYAEAAFDGSPDAFEGRVVSSWGPYTSIVGTAVKTGVAGLTTQAENVAKAEQRWQSLGSEEQGRAWAATGSQLADAFNKVDADGNGSISHAELAAAIKVVDPASTDEEVATMVAVADEDEDGEVTLPEFVMLMLYQRGPALAK